MDFLSGPSSLDPIKVLQHRTFLSSRMRSRQQAVATSKFWMDPKFSTWESASKPALIWLKGDYNNRLEVHSFAIDIISLLRRQKIPILWVLKSVSTHGATAASMIDLVKGLVCQALRFNVALHTENSLALSCAQFRAADTLEQWFDLLGSAIRTLPLLYIVVDLQAVGTSYSHNASWMTHLFAMFRRHTSRNWIARLKILLVSYGARTGDDNEASRYRDLIVLARNHLTKPTPFALRRKQTPQTLMAGIRKMPGKSKVLPGQH
jgi:hypothetical protein